MSIAFFRDHDRRFLIVATERSDTPASFAAGVSSRCLHHSVKFLFVPLTDQPQAWLSALKLTRIYQAPGFEAAAVTIDRVAAVLGSALRRAGEGTERLPSDIRKLMDARQQAYERAKSMLDVLYQQQLAVLVGLSGS